MATHSSILVWSIPWTEEPCGLQFMGSQRVGHNLATEQQQQRDSGVVSTLCHRLSMSKVASVMFFAILWTVACQALLSTEFSRQEYWSGLPCLPPGDLPDPGIKPKSPVSPLSPALQAYTLSLSHLGSLTRNQTCAPCIRSLKS